MATYDLGKVVGDAGEKGDDGSTVWNTSTAPTYANSKYTFTISNLSGKTGLEIAVNDIIFYSTYYYIVSAVNTTTVDCSTRVSIKGSDASVTIVDNLTTNDATKVLSAKQGKVLNDNKLEKTHSSYKGKNVVTNASTGTIEFEDKPTIPTKTSDLINDGADGTNIFVSNNDSRLSDARTPSSHTHGQITNAGAITSTAVTVASGDNIVITDASDSSKIKRVANILSDHVKDGTAHTNIGSSASATQSTINSSIDTALGNKQATLVSGTNIKTVNNETLLGSGNITIQGGSSVDVVTSWEATLSDSKVPSEKLVKNSLDDKISKSSTSGLIKNDGSVDTSTYVETSAITDMLTTNDVVDNLTTSAIDAPLSAKQGKALKDSLDTHTHGNLSNDGKVGSNANYIVVTGTGGAITSVQKLGNITYDGKIGSTSGKPVITTTSGTVTTGSFGSTAGTFAEGNHTHSGYISTSSTTGLIKNDGTIMTSGTGSTNYSAGNHTHSGYVSATKVTSWQSTPSDSNVPSEKLVKDSLDDIEDLIGDAIAYINQ